MGSILLMNLAALCVVTEFFLFCFCFFGATWSQIESKPPRVGEAQEDPLCSSYWVNELGVSLVQGRISLWSARTRSGLVYPIPRGGGHRHFHGIGNGFGSMTLKRGRKYDTCIRNEKALPPPSHQGTQRQRQKPTFPQLWSFARKAYGAKRAY